MFYPAKIEQVGDQYNIRFRDIPEALACADQVEDRLKVAQEALLAALALYFEERCQVHLPSEAQQGEVFIAIPTSVFAKVLLLNAMLEQNISNADLAQRLNIKTSEMQHMLSPHHNTEIESIAQALAALGKQLAIATV